MTANAMPVETRVSRCAVCKIDLKGRFVYIDSEAEKLLGSTQVELFGRQLLDFLDLADHEVIEQITARCNRYETFFDSTRVILVDTRGHRIPVTVIISLNFNAGLPVNHQIIINPDIYSPDTVGNGAATDFLCYMTGLTDLSAAEELASRLREFSGARSVTVYDAAVDPPSLLSSSDLDEDRNQEAEPILPAPMLEPSSEEIEAPPAGRFLISWQPDPTQSKSRQASVHERMHQALALVRRLFSHGGSELSDTYEMLNRSSLVESLDRLGIGAMLLGNDGVIIDSNQACRQLFEPDPVGETFTDLVEYLTTANAHDLAESIRAYFETCDHHEAPPNFRCALKLPSGRQTRLTIFRLVPGSDDRSAFFIFQPVLADREDTAYSKISDEFLSRVLAQLGSTVTAARELSQKIEHDYYQELGSQAGFSMNCLGNHLGRLNGVLAELIQVAELAQDGEEPQPTHLGLMVDQLISQIEATRPHITVSARYSDLPTIAANRKKLMVVLRSILDNAVKQADGVRMELDFAAHVERDCCQITIGYQGSGTGRPGIGRASDNATSLALLGQSAPDGSLLSLAAARELVRSMGGDLKIVSSSRRETNVSVSLPLHRI